MIYVGRFRTVETVGVGVGRAQKDSGKRKKKTFSIVFISIIGLKMFHRGRKYFHLLFHFVVGLSISFSFCIFISHPKC